MPAGAPVDLGVKSLLHLVCRAHVQQTKLVLHPTNAWLLESGRSWVSADEARGACEAKRSACEARGACEAKKCAVDAIARGAGRASDRVVPSRDELHVLRQDVPLPELPEDLLLSHTLLQPLCAGMQLGWCMLACMHATGCLLAEAKVLVPVPLHVADPHLPCRLHGKHPGGRPTQDRRWQPGGHPHNSWQPDWTAEESRVRRLRPPLAAWVLALQNGDGWANRWERRGDCTKPFAATALYDQSKSHDISASTHIVQIK